jgi:hypothetical protein
VKNLIIKVILEKLLNKKISIYVRDLCERSWFSGTLESINDEFLTLREKTDYTECLYYIPISEIVVVSESLK